MFSSENCQVDTNTAIKWPKYLPVDQSLLSLSRKMAITNCHLKNSVKHPTYCSLLLINMDSSTILPCRLITNDFYKEKLEINFLDIIVYTKLIYFFLVTRTFFKFNFEEFSLHGSNSIL